MDRLFEGRVDSEGHIDIPANIRERHGMTNGARILVEEHGDKVILEAFKSNVKRTNITDLAGCLSKEGNALDILLEERRREREREDQPFRP